MDKGESCYTFDAAMELAITMEEGSFRHYLEAIGIVKNKMPGDSPGIRARRVGA